MNEPSTASYDDRILGELFAALEGASDCQAVIEEFCRRYPKSADLIRGTADMNKILGDLTDAAPGMPARLGEFRIIREIDHGGMGNVYEAEQTTLKRTVAVKVIKHGHVSPEAKERFLREQVVLAQLHQTHIVPIFAAGEEGELQYFAMPYIEGAALHRVLGLARSLEGGTRKSSRPSLSRLAELCVKKQRTPRQQLPKESASPHRDRSAPTTRSELHNKTESLPPRTGDRQPRRLSPEYFRSVAEVMADAAEALQHAHEAGVLHRDLKPSNLMVDTSGHCWIIDFGLAGFVHHSRDVEPKSGFGGPPIPIDELPPQTLTHGLVGTLNYMAPEQFQEVEADTSAPADRRTDVWGLGATLYELLTWCRAFTGESPVEIRRRLCQLDPEPPRRIVPSIPADLAAICTKCLRKKPAQRYQSCAELAGDLRRWLRGEPTKALPARMPRRMWLWAKREKWQATAAALILLLAVTGTAGMLVRANARENMANERAKSATRFLRLQEIQASRMGTRESGWSQTSEQTIRDLTADGIDDNVRNQAAANLAGLDLLKLKPRTISQSASSVIFDADGQRLLVGGTNKNQPNPRQAAFIWSSDTDTWVASQQSGAGPVVFDDRGTALQLLEQSGPSLRLWNIDAQRAVRTFYFPTSQEGDIPLQHTMNEFGAVSAISPRGNLVAGSAAYVNEHDIPTSRGITCVWHRNGDEPLVKLDMMSTALAFSEDDELLAVGDDRGTILLWDVVRQQEVVTLNTGRMQINSLRFSHKLNWDFGDGHSQRRLLAAGGTGGHLSVWDVKTHRRISKFKGSQYDVFAFAFSPDGARLTSGGRYEVKIWDVRTGEQLLNVNEGQNYISGVDFSPRGDQLAASSITAHGYKGEVLLFDIQYGRGIRTLRGLTDRVRKLAISRDGKRLAALSDGWEIGLFDLDSHSGQLLQIFSAPKAKYGDNASIAFNPEGDLLAFSAGENARMWNTSTGAVLNRWDGLPPGLLDELMFLPSGELLLFRVETKGMRRPPFSDVPFEQEPRVCRVRDLLREGEEWRAALFEYERLNQSVRMAIACDAGIFLAAGVESDGQTEQDWVVALNGISGEEQWRRKGRLTRLVDPFRKVAGGYRTEHPDELQLFETRSNEPVRTLPITTDDAIGVAALRPNARGWLHVGKGERGYVLYDRESSQPLIWLGMDLPTTGIVMFSLDGKQFADANPDGTISVYDLPCIEDRLVELNLATHDSFVFD